MPLRGSGARDYSWCAVCREEVPSRTKLTAHLQGQHGLDLIPGCPDCFYYRARSGDVDKHCSRKHQKSRVSQARGQSGFRWGLTQLQETYKELTDSDVVEYPRAEESQSSSQVEFLSRCRKGRQEKGRVVPAERPASPVAGPSGVTTRTSASKRPRQEEREPRRRSPRKAQSQVEEPRKVVESAPAPAQPEQPATISPQKRKSSTPRKRRPPPSPAFASSDSSPGIVTPGRDATTSSERRDFVTVSSGEDDGSLDATHVSVHLSLSGDLNPVRLDQSATQTETLEFVAAGTSTETERFLYIGPEGRDESTQVGATTTSSGTQTELSCRDTDVVLVVSAGTTARLG